MSIKCSYKKIPYECIHLPTNSRNLYPPTDSHTHHIHTHTHPTNTKVLRTKIAAEVGNKAPDAPPSRMQVEVATTLSRLSIPHQSNVPVKNNLFQVDVVLQRPKQQVCILLLQPSDVIRGTYELLGSTMYRKKLLEAYGWKVLTLGFWEWQRAPSDDRDAQEAFLMTYLRKHGLLQ